MTIRTFIRPERQISRTSTFNDSKAAGSGLFNDAVTLSDDLDALRSQVKRTLGSTHFYDDIPTPTSVYGDQGNPKGLIAVGSSLLDIEKKRVLVAYDNYAAITVPLGQNWIVLSTPELPSAPAHVAAVGIGFSLGSVVEWMADVPFGTGWSNEKVVGNTDFSPKNLCSVTDAATHDPVLSDNRVVYALAQSESNLSGSEFSGTSPNRLQLSFVRLDIEGSAFEAVPVADIEGRTLRYSIPVRVTLQDLNEQNFLRGSVTDFPATSTETRQRAYDNQATTPVELTSQAYLKLATNIGWSIQDTTSETIFGVFGGTGQGDGTVTVGATETFFSDALSNNLAHALVVNQLGDSPINMGQHPMATNFAEIRVSDLSQSLHVSSESGGVWFSDGYTPLSSWDTYLGIPLASSATEWDDYRSTFGQVSILGGIYKAYTTSARNPKVYARVLTTVPAGTPVGGTGGGSNLSTQLPDFSLGDFLNDYDVYLNGDFLQGGLDANADNDYYGVAGFESLGVLKFEFPLFEGDVICVVPYV